MKTVYTFIFSLCVVLLATAQTVITPNRLSDQVEQLHRSGAEFQTVNLFQPQEKSISDQPELKDKVRAGTLLQLDQQAIQRTLNDQPSAVNLRIPTGRNEEMILELYKVNLFADGFRMVDENGNLLNMESGVHYRGVIQGDVISLAAISIFENEVAGVISSDEGNFVIGKLDGQAGHIFYSEFDLTSLPQMECFTEDDIPDADDGPIGLRSGEPCVVELYIEVNNDIYEDKRSNTGAYIQDVFNQSAALYESEGIKMVMSEVKIITGKRDGYKGNDSAALLSAFQSTSADFNGDLAIMLSYKGGGGIAAGFDGLCNSDSRNSMCFAGISNTFSEVPTYSWTVMVFTHELGHLFGSRHTHACVWNGNNTAIDGCYNMEGGCTSPGYPDGGGTIMSYCHLSGRPGINLSLGFGPQPGDRIRAKTKNSSCIATCDPTGSGPSCFDGVKNGDETDTDCGGSCSECGVNPPTGGSCDAPTGLQVTNIKGNRATLNWDAVSGASVYNIRIRPAGSVNWEVFPDKTGTSLGFRGFSVGVPYEWEVQAVCSSGPTTWSGTCTFVAGDSASGNCGSAALLTDLSTLKVFPNPATDLIRVSYSIESEEKLELRLVDITGRTVERRIVAPGMAQQTAINVGTLAKGMYILHLGNRSVRESLKVVVQ